MNCLKEECDKWYALFVVTGDEDDVKERVLYRLGSRGIKAVVPKRRLFERKNGVVKSKIRYLFPGYVLLNGQVGVEEYYSLKGIPGLIRILKDKTDLLMIDKREIGIISALMDNSETIEPSKVFIDGGRVVVTDGPLYGLEGLIESVDRRKGRAKVRLNFIGEDRLVDLGISIVQPA